jgi:O-antigen/teichoic acid export membrane protein
MKRPDMALRKITEDMRYYVTLIFQQGQKWMEQHPARAGVFAGWFQQSATAFSALLVVPVLMRVLSPTEAGQWFSFQGFLAMAGLVDLGLGFAISRQAAHCLGGNVQIAGSDFLDFGHGREGVAVLHKTAKRILRTVVGLMLASGVIIFELILPHTKLFGNNDQIFLRPVWYMMLGGAVLFFSGLVEMAILNGLGKVYLTRFYSGIYFLSNGILLVIAAWGTHSLTVMALAFLVCSLFFRLLLGFITRRMVPDIYNYNQRVTNLRHESLIIPLCKVAIPVGTVNIGAFLFSTVQVPLLGALLGPVVVAPFYFAQKIGQFLSTAATQPIMPQLPFFTNSLGGNRFHEAKHIMVKAVWLNGALVLLANLVFFFCSPYFFHALTGKDAYIPPLTLGLMALDYLILNSVVVFGFFVLASGKNPFVWTTLISGFLNVILITLLVPKYGIIAIPCASLLVGLMINNWYNPYKGTQLLLKLKFANSTKVS